MRSAPRLLLFLILACCGVTTAGDGNRLTYLDDPVNPYHVGLGFPKLTTPQWVGEDGVEAVVVLAVDDMREGQSAKYETFLRPILDRLKQIDGRAPVSIMTCSLKPDDPQLQSWLKEGVNLDIHTLTHPCPLLQKGDFDAAAKTYHGGIDLVGAVPNNKPVAFRMPCCDSMDSLSPRFFAEIFNRTSEKGNFLSIDSSVFNILTPADPSLPRALVEEADGREKFRKYLPFPSFVNTIENYPYPYVIGKTCWEFPCVVPSDWEAQNIQKPNNPKTVVDLKAALDAIVLKRGVFTMVFHPHGWIENTQVVELIDHAVKKHGGKVKFLNFREALERIEKNLLTGESLRNPHGLENGIRLMDVNDDGYIDVLIGNGNQRATRVWDSKARRWAAHDMPFRLTSGDDDLGARFATLGPDAPVACLVRGDGPPGSGAFWVFNDGRWRADARFLAGLDLDGEPRRGARFRDLDHDGISELIIANDARNAVHAWSNAEKSWRRLGYGLPEGARIADADGRDAGARFIDIDEDGFDDIVFAANGVNGVRLFESIERGWTRIAPNDAAPLPDIVRNGANQGFWMHSRSLWWQNENTAALPDHVDRRAFNDLLRNVEPRLKSPEAALKSIRVRSGFTVALAAREPLVEDPIAFDWGAEGKLWVVEMGDYPLGVDGKGQRGGVVRFLEDMNNDGEYDKSTTFLDNLGYPTGVMPWKNGVLVACAPDILYAEDTNGDGKADVKKVLFTGFKEGNPQHRLNGFELGLDGWIYGANGDSGGVIKSSATGQETNISGRDFRFNPDTGAFEAESGQTQFGRHRDDWGRWFGNNNPNIAWQYVLTDTDLKKNSRVAPRDVRKMLDNDNHVYPLSRTLPRFNDFNMSNRITSANSPTPYRDDLFGPAFENNLFVSEPVHNLIRRVVLEPDGSSLKGRRFGDEANREFLASSDNAFRPTMLRTGPDGALWIADMYRAVIEHPEWIPDDWEKRLDLRAGHDQGRIYRVFPVAATPRAFARLDGLDTLGLVAALDSPNGWRRDTAQRLLMHRSDPTAIEPLRRLAADSKNPKARAQALWTLRCLDAMTPVSIENALKDEHPRVRENAARIAGSMLGKTPELGTAIASLVADPDPAVRLTTALALSEWDDPRAAVALARLGRENSEDPWMRAAVLCSASKRAAGILAALFEQGPVDAVPGSFVEALFATAGASDQRKGLIELVRLVTTPRGPNGRPAAWQFNALRGLLDATARGNSSIGKRLGDDAEAGQARAALDTLFTAAREVAANTRVEPEDRAAAVLVLGQQSERVANDRDQLAGLLAPSTPVAVQQAAVAALSRLRDPKVPDLLLARWKGHSPSLRNTILDALLGRAEWTADLIAAIEDTCVPAAEIDPSHRQRLLKQPDTALRQRAEALFAGGNADRAEVLRRYQSALTLKGAAAAGAAAFKKHCASCHRFQGEGNAVGPDLAELTDKSPESLAIAILDPNRAFEAKYAAYMVATRDGRVLNGIVSAETATSITLSQQDGKEVVVLRADLEQLSATGQSLMPEGVEKDITPQALADLFAYLRSSPERK